MFEQLYKFIDKTGSCFESFQEIGKVVDGNPSPDRLYHDHVGAMLRASHNDEHFFGVGDMMVFKDELLEAGFKWGVDFYIIKVNKESNNVTKESRI